jgi:hypothetical protein
MTSKDLSVAKFSAPVKEWVKYPRGKFVPPPDPYQCRQYFNCGNDAAFLISEPVQLATEGIARAEPLDMLGLKGLHWPVNAFNVSGLQ